MNTSGSFITIIESLKANITKELSQKIELKNETNQTTEQLILHQGMEVEIFVLTRLSQPAKAILCKFCLVYSKKMIK